KRFAKARGLYGRTLGLVGTGAIARATGQRALAFGMRVRAYSRSFTHARALELGFERAESLLDVVHDADVLSLHVPASPETKRMISRQVLASLKDGALLVNTSRADVVDPE